MSSTVNSSPLIITITFPTKDLALKTGDSLLEARLAAAYHLSAVKSRYWWKGKIRTANEWVLSLRATSARFAAISRTVKAKHPYELPEIIGTKVAYCAADYRRWITT